VGSPWEHKQQSAVAQKCEQDIKEATDALVQPNLSEKEKAQCYLELAAGHDGTQKFQQALDDLKKASQLDRSLTVDIAYVGIRAEVEINLGRFKDALADCDRALSMKDAKFGKQGIAQLQLYRGIALVKLSKPEEAIGAFSQAISLNPAPLPYAKRGLCYYDGGKYNLALSDFTASLKLDPTDTNVQTLKRAAEDKLK
jgi:tetratricopeptide (TPR) repeat protein